VSCRSRNIPKQIAAALITHKRRLIVTAKTVSYPLLIIYTPAYTALPCM